MEGMNLTQYTGHSLQNLNQVNAISSSVLHCAVHFLNLEVNEYSLNSNLNIIEVAMYVSCLNVCIACVR